MQKWTTPRSIPLPDRISGADLSGKEGYGVAVSGATYVLASDGGADCVGFLSYAGTASGDVCSANTGEVFAVHEGALTANHLADTTVDATGQIRTAVSGETVCVITLETSTTALDVRRIIHRQTLDTHA